MQLRQAPRPLYRVRAFICPPSLPQGLYPDIYFSIDTPSTSSPDSSQTTASSGYTEDQKIALGCGIGIGLPATIASLILLWMKCFKKR